jgi:hypothetical protein
VPSKKRISPAVGPPQLALEVLRHAVPFEDVEELAAPGWIDVELAGDVADARDQGRGRIVAQHPCQRGIRGDETALERGLEDPLDGVLEDASILLFGLAQCLLGAHAVRDVGGHVADAETVRGEEPERAYENEAAAEPPGAPERRIDGQAQHRGRGGAPDAVAVRGLDAEGVGARIEVREGDVAARAELDPLIAAEPFERVGILIAARKDVVESGELQGEDLVPRPEGERAAGGPGAGQPHRPIEDAERGEDDGRDEAVRPDLVGIEVVETLSASEEQTAAARAVTRAQVERQALQAAREVEALDVAGAGIETRQPLIRAQPEPSGALLGDAADEVAREVAVDRGRAGLGVEEVEAATQRAHPEAPFVVVVQRAHPVVAQALRVLRIVPIALESRAPAAQEVKPVQGADPQVARRSALQSAHPAEGASALGPRKAMMLGHEPAFGIEAVEAEVVPQPQPALLIVGDRPDVVVGEAAGIPGPVLEHREGPALRIEESDPAAIRADPQAAARVLVERENGGAAGLGRRDPVRNERPAFAIEAVEPAALGPHPEAPFAVLEERAHVALAQAPRIGRAVGVVVEGVMRAAQHVGAAEEGADPDLSLAVFVERADDAFAQRARVGIVVAERGKEAPARGVVALHTLLVRADPDGAGAIHEHGRQEIRDEPVRPLRVMRIALARPGHGIEPAEAASVRGDPDPPAGVPGQAPDVVMDEAARLRGIVPIVDEPPPVRRLAAPPRPQEIDAGVARADPQPPVAIREKGRDRIAAQAAGIVGRVCVPAELARRGITLEEALAFGADPEDAGAILDDARHALVNGGNGRERLGLAIHDHEPVVRAHPEPPRAVFVESGHHAVGKAAGIARVVPVDDEGVAVVAVEALLRAEPEETNTILEDGLDRRLRQSLLDGDAGEARGLGTDGRRQRGRHPEKECRPAPNH